MKIHIFALLALLVLFLLPMSASAAIEGDIIRGGDDGNILLWRVDSGKCYGINLLTVKDAVPTTWTPAFSVLMKGLAPMRPLSPAERALCTGDPIQVKRWRVHNNGNITRPAYTYSNDLLIKSKTERANIGELCGNLAVKVKNSKTREYRYLVRRPELVSICVFE